MAEAQAETALHFEAPGAGSWDMDPVHFPRPMTRYWTEIHPAGFKRGTSEFTRFYGMMLDSLEMVYINGFGYKTARPVSPEEAPARFARAEEAYAGKLWRAQLREWDEEAKPAAIAIDRELQAIDPDALSDEELVAYLRRCAAHHGEMIYQHMRFTAGAVLPTGDFLAHVGEWTGLSHARLLDLMRGASPVSAGASAELDELVAALAGDAAARELLESDEDPGALLARLRSLGSPAGAAANAYLDLVGWRLLDGFDISEPCALELPDVLLRAIRIAVATAGSEAAAGVDAEVAKVREEVPEGHRGEFDELLAEARLMYRLRDERGVFSDIWASGLMRRATLAAGRRLAAAGRIAEPEHLIDAGLEEMCALLAGSEQPSAEELAGRAAYRASLSAKDAPQELGDPPAPPPDPSGLPPGAARVMRAIGVALGELFGSSEEEHGEHVLRGLAASRGIYEGPARRIAGPAEFGRIVQGDVLVTESTSEAFNILLPLLGAIVTDRGGLLSHSAIVAREYGIPGVVGTREATERIADGVRVRVDGDSGEVTVLA
ncbi:MAG TPA: PEP-utilizing enzyme [Solirubrobacteraceae bacterium]|jgi:pyruvate,water dikinase|nr:PEP-utilizing enzyme [Solirubrobacteraceae bacterium]